MVGSWNSAKSKAGVHGLNPGSGNKEASASNVAPVGPVATKPKPRSTFRRICVFVIKKNPGGVSIFKNFDFGMVTINFCNFGLRRFFLFPNYFFFFFWSTISWFGDQIRLVVNEKTKISRAGTSLKILGFELHRALDYGLGSSSSQRYVGYRALIPLSLLYK